MIRDEKGWIRAYEGKDALWIHDGNHRRPHALLTSGKHSNGFFFSKPVTEDEQLLSEAASDLVERLSREGVDLSLIQAVVGPQTGATKLAEAICAELLVCYGVRGLWFSPAKHEQDGKKSMRFDPEEGKRVRGRKVLLCEDVLSTGGSVGLTAEAVSREGGSVLPFVLMLVNRSGLREVDGKKIIPLIDYPMPMWNPTECELCNKKGSTAISPKRPPENWALLNAVY